MRGKRLCSSLAFNFVAARVTVPPEGHFTRFHRVGLGSICISQTNTEPTRRLTISVLDL